MQFEWTRRWGSSCLRQAQSVLVAAGCLIGLEGSAAHVPGRVLAMPRVDASEAEVRGLLASVGAAHDGEVEGLGVLKLRVPEQAVERVAAALRRHPKIQFAELDEWVAPSLVPNDPYYGSQWHLPKIAAPTAWEVETGANELVIAIVDTGVDASHPDLASLIVPGWNVYGGDSNTADVYGHGTPVAGAAAARGNNAMGVSGVVWNCRIMPVRISDSTGYATYSAMASGLRYAIDHGARVINLSYRGSESGTVTTAAQYVFGKGGVVTISAGNDGLSLTAADNPYVLTVGATTSGDVKASYSNSGAVVDLVAPGSSVYLPTRGGGYGSKSGTSFSAPLVAGAAAALLSLDPGLTPGEVFALLKQNADDLGTTGPDSAYGAGRLNVGRAIESAADALTRDTTAPLVRLISPTTGATVTGPANVVYEATDASGIVGVEVYLNGALLYSSANPASSFSWDSSIVAEGSYSLEVVALDAANNEGTSGAVTVWVVHAPVVDTTPPTVAITAPVSGSKVGKFLRATVVAADNVGVVRVELLVNGKVFATSSSSPASFTVNTRMWRLGENVITARAWDAAGHQTLSAPIVVIK